ncbi:uncharacterized protein LOC128966487, partial [Oppia nitens]|uniref:uncharacterized protein LOC128966487 n=1 Tax=Oppia nitens TaxID=1686743 RepID=UPI0023DCD988
MFRQFCHIVIGLVFVETYLCGDQFEWDSIIDESNTYCLQNRILYKNDENNPCHNIYTDFCGTIQCEPIFDCDVEASNGKKAIVENITGHGCCPACVTYLDEEELCDVSSLSVRCRNGLDCDPSSGQCVVPTNKLSERLCLKEYNNKKKAAELRATFYIKNDLNPKNDLNYPIIFYDSIELPDCDDNTGQYKLKQCRDEKCFCVNPIDGKPTFGLSLRSSAENITCQCAQHFYEKFTYDPSRNKQYDVDLANLEHWSQIHSKCDHTGNYEALQCINQTCFCVDEKTGRPLASKTSMYGALSSLPCYDEQKFKKLNTKEADANYQNSCEQYIIKTQALSLEFLKKGAELNNMGDSTCTFDGSYKPTQCKPATCKCVNPKDGTIFGPYNLDRNTRPESDMECRCALQTFYQRSDYQQYNELECDAMGNFKAYQCSKNALGQSKCHCADSNGARISEDISTKCLDKFMDEKQIKIDKETICQTLRWIIIEQVISDDNMYFQYDSKDNGHHYNPINKPSNIIDE